MIDPRVLNNTELAILLWREAEAEEPSVWVVVGRCEWREGVLRWSDGNKAAMEVQTDWLPRITATQPAVAEVVFNAPFMLSLSVGMLPKDVDLSSCSSTGIRLTEK